MEAQVLQDDVFVVMKINATNYSLENFLGFWRKVFLKHGKKLRKNKIYTLEDLAKHAGFPVKFYLYKCYGKVLPEEVKLLGKYLKFMT